MRILSQIRKSVYRVSTRTRGAQTARAGREPHAVFTCVLTPPSVTKRLAYASFNIYYNATTIRRTTDGADGGGLQSYMNNLIN